MITRTRNSNNKPFNLLTLFTGVGGGLDGFLRQGSFKSVGAFDCDAGAIRNMEKITGCKGHVVDLEFILPHELRARCTGTPDVVFTSPPCKGFSACLPKSLSKQEKYLRLNELSMRGIWLTLEAFKDDLPGLILMENVPRIRSRGKEWLERIRKILHAYGYAVTERVYNCGELGGLHQSRERFLLMARKMDKVRNLVYEPVKRNMRPLGEALSLLPIPTWEEDGAGPMHVLPNNQFGTLLRLACVTPGQDWKSLPTEVELKFRKARQNGGYGINDWLSWSHTVIATSKIGVSWSSTNDLRVTSPEEIFKATGRLIVNPQMKCKRRKGSGGVTKWTDPSVCIIGRGTHHNGPWQVDDDRKVIATHELRKGVLYGPEVGPKEAGPFIIRAESGAWHRPYTPLEKALLQSFDVKRDGKWLDLGGTRQQQNEWIGNAVPPETAKAIAQECAATLQASRDGTFRLSTTPVWVAPQSLEVG